MEPSGNTETEEEALAPTKKSARRVSFADTEITSVHLFQTDAGDSDTPVDDDDVVRGSFLRPIGPPSPVPATTDDAEDVFHGPVSASFIRPGRSSDSAASESDDNHDLTMDSTAFSLHYRSLARSDSGDLILNTPSTVEDKTPTQTSIPAPAPGSFMMLSKDKKQSSVPADTASAARDSNDMSIVEGNPHRYDYDRLSPSLDAILAEGSKDVCAVSTLDSSASDSSNRRGYSMAKGSTDSAMGNHILEASTLLPSVQEPPSESLHCNMQGLYHALQISQSPLTKSGAEISSGKKRKFYEILRDGNYVDKIGRIDRSPELHKGGKNDLQLVLEQTGDIRSERVKLGDQAWKNWADV